jgi:hypothetical protein
VWLNQLGEAKAETLEKLMELFAKGVIIPHSGECPSLCLKWAHALCSLLCTC